MGYKYRSFPDKEGGHFKEDKCQGIFCFIVYLYRDQRK